MINKLIGLAAIVGLLSVSPVVVYAAPYPTIGQDVGVCDVNAPSHCLKPAADGSIVVTGGGSGGGAVYGPTAVGAAAANPPVIVGGTANATATGTVQVQKVDSSGNTYTVINAAIPAGSNVIGHVIADTGSTTAVTQATAANLNATVVGTGTFAVQNTAATPAGTNVIGGITRGDATQANAVSGTTAAMTGTTSTSLVAAPGASLRNYILNITCVNSHTTVGTFVTVQDGSGGTALYSLAAASVYGGSSITFPYPGLRQPTTNTALYVADVTTGANVICSASGYKGS